ncbi:MAG: universal stress protein [candidate division WOR-3 bacterium]|jgi:nucleotide-binding universal stress UspA family protein
MIKRILLAISDPANFQPLARWTIELAAACSAQVLAAYFLPEAPNKKTVKKSSSEEKAWQVLYQIEDKAFEQNVRISLLIETGDLLERLGDLCRSYQIDLLVVSAAFGPPPEKLLRQAPKPVIFYQSDKEA